VKITFERKLIVKRFKRLPHIVDHVLQNMTLTTLSDIRLYLRGRGGTEGGGHGGAVAPSERLAPTPSGIVTVGQYWNNGIGIVWFVNVAFGSNAGKLEVLCRGQADKKRKKDNMKKVVG